jgi:hypothetical protein
MVLDSFASGFIIFFSAGLMVYWCSRTLMLLRESDEELNEVLEDDLWWGRRVLSMLRLLFFPSSPTMAA